MTIRRSSLYLAFSLMSLSQYSRAAAGSWIEQGPIMTSRRWFGSLSLTMATDSLRPWRTVPLDLAVWGISCWRRSGAVRGLYPRTTDTVSHLWEADFESTYFSSLLCSLCCQHVYSQCGSPENESDCFWL